MKNVLVQVGMAVVNRLRLHLTIRKTEYLSRGRIDWTKTGELEIPSVAERE